MVASAPGVSAWLQGGNVGAWTTIQSTIQAITSGTLNVTIDGYPYAVTGLNLSTATSLSATAGLIQTALGSAAPSEVTFTGSVSGNVLTVTGTPTGTLSAGQTVTGTSVTSGSVILVQLTGTAGQAGTYELSKSSTAGSESLTASATAPAVTYDSLSGGFLIT
jgi:hypothetical protein